jgi:hypothetical protein
MVPVAKCQFLTHAPQQKPSFDHFVGGNLQRERNWAAPGSEDTELGVLMELEVGHGETEVYPRVQA